MSKFLDDLKNAADKGEFNSEAAKKIIEVDKLADNANVENLADRIEKAGVKTVTEEEASIINSDYEKKMLEIKEKDLALHQIAILKEIDETLMLSLYDMKDFITTVETSFDKTKPVNVELFQEVEKIKNKYSSIINLNQII
jgi:hypothetical protein